MNILIIGTTDVLGGAAKVSWSTKTALETQGHNVSMFVADKRSNDPTVHTIARSVTRKYASIFFASERFLSTDWILGTEEFMQADLIHCHNLHGRYFNLRTLQHMAALKPVVWTLHDEWALTPHCAYTLEGTELKNGLYTCPSINTQPRILWNNTSTLIKEKNCIYNALDIHLVTPSLWLQNRTKNTTLGKQKLHLIPNGIETVLFTQTEKAVARKKLDLPQEKKIVLFLATAGKANTWKGWVYAEKVIDAYRERDDVLFLNVGNLQAEENETNVEYRAHVQDESELALYYSAADVLLFTSIAENFPLVILEAMSCGTPIVAFDVGGVREVLTHKENGYIAPYKDSKALIAGIDWAFKLDAVAQKKLSSASIEKIRTAYDTRKMTDTYIKLYKSILKEHD